MADPGHRCGEYGDVHRTPLVTSPLFAMSENISRKLFPKIFSVFSSW
jgi:hypothetical protein